MIMALFVVFLFALLLFGSRGSVSKIDVDAIVIILFFPASSALVHVAVLAVRAKCRRRVLSCGRRCGCGRRVCGRRCGFGAIIVIVPVEDRGSVADERDSERVEQSEAFASLTDRRRDRHHRRRPPC
jgi:hypothetical protein